jgi:hypothetical protein
MHPTETIEALNVLSARLRPVLESDGVSVLMQARSEVQDSFDRYQTMARRNPPTDCEWGYTIYPEKPLRFRETTVHGFRLRADVSCRLRWLDPNGDPTKQELAVRIWCLNDEVMFRDQLDAPAVLERLDFVLGRVMVRYHYDKANEEQPGPDYHLQMGGNSRDEGLCWLHEGVAIPRVAHSPRDLVLACEELVANLYTPDHVSIQDPTFAHTIKVSQEALLASYYARVVDAISSGKSVLRSLWVGATP